MSGIWTNARCIYQQLFSDPAPAKPAKLSPPPPISPLEALNFRAPMHHDDELNELIEAQNTPQDTPTNTPPMFEDTEYIIKCEEALAIAVQAHANLNLKNRRRDDSFGTIVGALTLGHTPPKDPKTEILDCTGSFVFPLMMRHIGYTGAITVHPPTPTLCKAELTGINKNIQDVSFNFTNFCKLDDEYMKKFACVYIDAIITSFDLVCELLKKFSASVSTGTIYVHVRYNTGVKMCEQFPELSFEYVPTKGNARSHEFRAHYHSVLMVVTHARGGVAKRVEYKINRRGPNSSLASLARAKRTKPASPPVSRSPSPLRPSSPLACDFTFDNLLESIQEMALEPHDNTFLNMLAPLPEPPVDVPLYASVEDDDDDPPLEFVSALAPSPKSHSLNVILTGQVEEEASQQPSDDVEEEEVRPCTPQLAPSSPVRFAVEESPEEVSPEEETRLQVIDLTEETSGIDYLGVVARSKQKDIAKTLRILPTHLPDWSSPEFGGSTPMFAMSAVLTLAELVCDWTRTHPDAKAFLDVRSKGFVAAAFYTIFPREALRVGHVTYSNEYRDACRAIYCFLRRSASCPYGDVQVPLAGMEAKAMYGYQMGFASAGFLDETNFDLHRIVESFKLSSTMQVLWIQLTKSQCSYVTETFKNVQCRKVDRKFSARNHSAPLYELTK